MLVVRSQDKKSLIVDDVVYVINNCGYIYCDKVSFQEGFIMAKYSNEKKAIKVLDMLEKALIESLDNLYFKFPKDNEVEV